MEDWEQFFVEKSRRRAEAERRGKRRAYLARATIGALLAAAIIAGLVALDFR